ncbi:MAG: hypothetical protein QOH68_4337 [Nocardioidaceae bacterium]|jgi:hypothetical protein|nr:hypothetical protein [Nocardioidaceae bacterium]
MTEPERRLAPEPVASDEVRVVAVGTVLFAIGLVVTVVLHERLEDDGRGDWVWIMACGVLLGLIGIRTVRRRRGSLRTDATNDPSTGEPGPNLP